MLWVALFCLGTPISGAGQDLLAFQHVAGDRFRVVTEVSEDVFFNGVFSHHADILNRVAIEVTEVRSDGAGLLAGTYQTVERGADDSSQGVTYGPLEDEYYAEFWRTPRGAYEIADGVRMPVIRNVPFFPETEIEPGTVWSAVGEEVHDFRRNFGVSDPFRFPITVNYEYLGRQQLAGREVGVIKIDYTIFHRVPMALGLADNPPEKLTGISQQLLYWDFQLGLPVAYEEDFNFIIHLVSGDVLEFEGRSTGELMPSEPLNRTEVIRDIQQQLLEKGVADAGVFATDQGVTITLENVQFSPDSDFLDSTERDKLDKIADILRGFPNRDLLIAGHTARVGSEQSSQLLSERRAASVGDYLVAIGAKSPQRLVFQGFGSRRPVADNVTPEGRSRNRRVEITILEN